MNDSHCIGVCGDVVECGGIQLQDVDDGCEGQYWIHDDGYLKSAVDENFCITILNGRDGLVCGTGSCLSQVSSSNHSNQRFFIRGNRLFLAFNEGLALGIAGDRAAGDGIELKERDNTDDNWHQIWYGFRGCRSMDNVGIRHDGHCMGVPDLECDWPPVALAEFDGCDGQFWVMEDGYIKPSCCPEKCLTVCGGNEGFVDGGSLVLADQSEGLAQNQQWENFGQNVVLVHHGDFALEFADGCVETGVQVRLGTFTNEPCQKWFFSAEPEQPEAPPTWSFHGSRKYAKKAAKKAKKYDENPEEWYITVMCAPVHERKSCYKDLVSAAKEDYSSSGSDCAWE